MSDATLFSSSAPRFPNWRTRKRPALSPRLGGDGLDSTQPRCTLFDDDALARQMDFDGGAEAGLAVDLETPAVQLGERLGERQAEPSALVAPVEAAVELAEGRERRRDVLPAHADPSVGDRDRQPTLGGVADGDANAATRRREFNR